MSRLKGDLLGGQVIAVNRSVPEGEKEGEGEEGGVGRAEREEEGRGEGRQTTSFIEILNRGRKSA